MRVLVVEDEFLVRLELCQVLAGAEYEVDQAANGRIAIERMRSHCPDLILLDLRMPVMDGFDFRAQQLSDPDLATVPVIVVSATSEDARIPALRAAAVVSKPASSDAVLKLTNDLLRPRT
jgi:CheY-like chemotaxis protein